MSTIVDTEDHTGIRPAEVKMPLLHARDAIKFVIGNDKFRTQINSLSGPYLNDPNFYWEAKAQLDSDIGVWAVTFKSNFDIPEYFCLILSGFRGDMIGEPGCKYDPHK